MLFLPLEAAHEVVHIPAWVYGVVAFVVMLLLLQVLRGFGKSRPHS